MRNSVSWPRGPMDLSYGAGPRLPDGRVPLDDPAEIRAGRQGAEGAAPIVATARGAERVGDRRVAEADQQRALQDERHPLDQAPGAGLDLAHVAELGSQRVSGGVESGIGSARLVDLAEERLERLGAADHRPQDV